MCPPRIMANDAALSMIVAPGRNVHATAAGIHEVWVGRLGRRLGPHADHAVLAHEDDVATVWDVVGREHRYADAEVDDAAVE